MDWVSSAKILLSSTISSILTYVLISQLTFSNPIRFVLGVIAFVVVFIAATLVTQTINKADMINLREIIEALGPTS